MKEEALDSSKAMGSASIDPQKPSTPVHAFLGGISANVITLILYKFTITIEASLNRQAVSDNFSFCSLLSCPLILYLFFCNCLA